MSACVGHPASGERTSALNEAIHCGCPIIIIPNPTFDHEPVLDFYGPKIVHHIAATQKPLNVLRSILDKVAQLDVTGEVK